MHLEWKYPKKNIAVKLIHDLPKSNLPLYHFLQPL